MLKATLLCAGVMLATIPADARPLETLIPMIRITAKPLHPFARSHADNAIMQRLKPQRTLGDVTGFHGHPSLEAYVPTTEEEFAAIRIARQRALAHPDLTVQQNIDQNVTSHSEVHNY